MGRRLAELAGQSAVYGLGTVVARFASLLLLPVYTHALTLEEFGRIELLVALVAVASTVAQLGMVNALFRFALERDGEARWAVVRTAVRFCFVTAAAATLVGVLATPFVADPLLGDGQETLWLVACFSLLVSLLNEALVGLYRVEARPWRFTAVTVVNVTVTVVLSVLAVTVFDAGPVGLLAGGAAGTAVAVVVVLIDRRARLRGPGDREQLGPMLRFGLPLMPSRLALWGLNFSNRLLVVWLASLAAAGLFAPALRIASAVALLVTAFQLAWPPYAYGIRDDDEARRVYRAVLTAWVALAAWVVLGLALLRVPIFELLAPPRYAPAADPMAIYAAGLGFYGAYYVVVVAVGRVKRTGFNWIVTGGAALLNVGLCALLVPDHGIDGAAVASLVSYLAMALAMAIRGDQLFPVHWEWIRMAAVLAVGVAVFLVADRVFAETGAGIAARALVALVFPVALIPLGAARLLRSA